MATGKTRMLSSLRVLHEELERIIDDVVVGRKRPSGAGSWSPPADVFVSKDMVVVRLEVAGVAASDIDLTYREGELVARGTRFESGSEPKQDYWQMEIQHGPFERCVKIQLKVDADRAQAVCRNGILEIRMPIVAPGRPEHHEVRIKTDG